MRFDLLIIGGGINGVGIARDAVGCGAFVLLLEQCDLAGATPSSPKLISAGAIDAFVQASSEYLQQAAE